MPRQRTKVKSGVRKPRILFYDLETSPLISYTWGTYDQNVIALKKDWELLSVAYKWQGERKVQCVARPNFQDKSDRTLTKYLWSLLNEADIVVAHNGDSFDNKKAEAKFIQHGLTPPTPYMSVDTRKVAKRYFRFTSNKLDALGELLGVGRKEKTGGFDLWLECMADTSTLTSAWRRMIKYNKQDVALLERVYDKLLPWIGNHPSVARLADRPRACPKCGSEHLRSHGFQYTRLNKYRRYKCASCGGYTRARAADTAVRMEVA